MSPIMKNPSKKKSTKTMKSKKRRSNGCCATSSSSSSYDESSSESSETSSESDSSDCSDCTCSDSDCSDCWECELPSRKRGGKKFKGKLATSKIPHKGKKKSVRRAKYSSSQDSSSCESSDDCYECVPKKPGRKARV